MLKRSATGEARTRTQRDCVIIAFMLRFDLAYEEVCDLLMREILSQRLAGTYVRAFGYDETPATGFASQTYLPVMTRLLGAPPVEVSPPRGVRGPRWYRFQRQATGIVQVAKTRNSSTGWHLGLLVNGFYYDHRHSGTFVDDYLRRTGLSIQKIYVG
jgi:hypothetical protein